jgi:hypothetical protein
VVRCPRFRKARRLNLPPFYWNYNAGAGYNAQNDPAYWAAQAKYQEDKRNSDLEDQEQQAEDLLTTKQKNLTDNTNAINSAFDANFGDGADYRQYAKDLMGCWQPDIDQQYTTPIASSITRSRMPSRAAALRRRKRSVASSRHTTRRT